MVFFLRKEGAFPLSAVTTSLAHPDSLGLLPFNCFPPKRLPPTARGRDLLGRSRALPPPARRASSTPYTQYTLCSKSFDEICRISCWAVSHQQRKSHSKKRNTNGHTATTLLTKTSSKRMRRGGFQKPLPCADKTGQPLWGTRLRLFCAGSWASSSASTCAVPAAPPRTHPKRPCRCRRCRPPKRPLATACR